MPDVHVFSSNVVCSKEEAQTRACLAAGRAPHLAVYVWGPQQNGSQSVKQTAAADTWLEDLDKGYGMARWQERGRQIHNE
eukprot:1146781-Pelagomonas_calceolata.AAC.13